MVFKFIVGATCACLAVVSFNSNAALITHNYSGEIDVIYDPNGYASSSSFFPGSDFAVGDTFAGQFTYDTDALLSGISGDGYSAIYLDGILEFSLEMNSLYLPTTDFPSSGDGTLSIADRPNGTDSLFAQSIFRNSDWFTIVKFSFQDNTGTVFNNMEIPNQLDLNDFHYLGFELGFINIASDDQLLIFGDVTSLAVVPIPPAAWLFGSGLIGLVGFARRK